LCQPASDYSTSQPPTTFIDQATVARHRHRLSDSEPDESVPDYPVDAADEPVDESAMNWRH
jgi:hypothetical protein